MAMTKEDKAAYFKAYREANREKIAAKDNAWRKANPNPEKVAANQRKWCKANPEKIKTLSTTRNIRRSTGLTKVPDEMVELHLAILKVKQLVRELSK